MQRGRPCLCGPSLCSFCLLRCLGHGSGTVAPRTVERQVPGHKVIPHGCPDREGRRLGTGLGRGRGRGLGRGRGRGRGRGWGRGRGRGRPLHALAPTIGSSRGAVTRLLHGGSCSGGCSWSPRLGSSSLFGGCSWSPRLGSSNLFWPQVVAAADGLPLGNSLCRLLLLRGPHSDLQARPGELRVEALGGQAGLAGYGGKQAWWVGGSVGWGLGGMEVWWLIQLGFGG